MSYHAGIAPSDHWLYELVTQFGRRTRLRYWEPPLPLGVLDPVAVARDAIAWLGDDRSFDGRRLSDWRLLKADLLLSLDQQGPELSCHLASAQAAARPSLELESGATQSDRARAVRSLETLLDALDNGEAAVAAWHDLLAAYEDASSLPEVCDLRESQLGAIGKNLRGHDWVFETSNLVRALNDRRLDVDELRAKLGLIKYEEIDWHLREGSAGLAFAERRELCDRYIARPPTEGDAVVWVVLDRLDISPGLIDRGRIRFYEGDWWNAVIATGDRGQLPSELASLEQYLLESFFHRLRERDAKEHPYVVARVELGRCRIAHAIDEARRAVEAVVDAAGLRAGQLDGRMLDGGILFVADSLVAQREFFHDSEFAAARRGPPHARGLGRSLVDMEETLIEGLLAGALPVRGALQAVRWLKETEDLPHVHQLGLSLRVIEQVFGEIDERHWRTVVGDRLRYQWALTRVSNCLEETVFNAIHRVPGAMPGMPTEAERAEFLEVREYVMGGGVFRARRAAERLEWLSDRMKGEPRLARELRTLATRFGDGHAAEAWLVELEQEFNRNVKRVQRVRNAILHGYPIEREVARAAAGFARTISFHAAHGLVDARADGVSIASHFDDLCRQYASQRAGLKRGMWPPDAFGWIAGT